MRERDNSLSRSLSLVASLPPCLSLSCASQCSAGMSQLRELMAAFTAWGVMTESMVTGAVGRRVESAGRVDPLVDTAVRHSRRHSKRITLTVKLGGCVLSTTLYDYKRK